MNKFNLFSSMCFFILSILICMSISANGGDLQALLSIKAHIIEDPLRILESWNNSNHFCNWSGVSCGPKHGRVLGLIIPGLELNGTLSTSIGNLTFLRDLVLDSNHFYGSIPQEINKLKHLQILNLNNNSFTGTIPSEIGSLSNLYKVGFGQNHLSGTIPPSIGNLSDLMNLDLSDNSLTGTIPAEIALLSKLNILHFSYNNLRGTIPPSIGNMSALYKLGLSRNYLTGTIPAQIALLSKLNILDIMKNNLRGTIPPSIGNMSALYQLFLFENSLTGTIPAQIGLLSKLNFLGIGNNNLRGTIPPSIGNMSALSQLYLSGNSLTEYAVGAPATTLVDVYSYGVVLLEMFSGKRPTDNMFKDDFSLHNYVNMAISEQVMSIADPWLFVERENNLFRLSGDVMRLNAGEIEKCLASVYRVGVMCSAHAPKDRMEIADALLILEKVRDALLKIL